MVRLKEFLLQQKKINYLSPKLLYVLFISARNLLISLLTYTLGLILLEKCENLRNKFFTITLIIYNNIRVLYYTTLK